MHNTRLRRATNIPPLKLVEPGRDGRDGVPYFFMRFETRVFTVDSATTRRPAMTARITSSGGRVLEEETVGLLGQGGEHRGVVVEGRQHDHGGARVLFLDPGQQFETVHAGHAHVRDEDIDGNPFQEGEEVAGRGEGAQHLDLGRGAQV